MGSHVLKQIELMEKKNQESVVSNETTSFVDLYETLFSQLQAFSFFYYKRA